MRYDIKMRHTTSQAAELQSHMRPRARIAVEHRDYRSKSPGSTPATARPGHDLRESETFVA